MFKIAHKFFNSFLTKPSVHYIKPKAINIFFKDSYQAKYFLLNTEKYNYIGIDGVRESAVDGKGNNINLYVLNLILSAESGTEVLPVAKFDNQKQLEEAIVQLKNKMYSPEKVGIKIVITTFIVLFLLSFIVNLVRVNITQTPVASLSQEQLLLQQMRAQGTGSIPPNMPPNVDPTVAFQALQQARQQADQIIAQGAKNSNAANNTYGNGVPYGAPNIPNNSPIEIPQDPAVSNFMNGLK